MASTLHIRLLGDLHLCDDHMPVTGVNTPRLQSLLAYLLLHREAPQSRSHIAFQFWPDSTEAQARSNLRTLLHRLRRALPCDDEFLFADAQMLQWRAEAPCMLDVADFEDLLTRAETAEQAGDIATERGALEQAVALYHGDLLPSCYDDWLLPERERLYQWYCGALDGLIQLLEEHRAYEEAIGYARQLVRHEPLHEAGYRRLMRLRALQGDRAGALRVYHTCATTLERELGVEPSPATQRVYEDLLQTEARPVPVAGAATGVSPLVGREEEWARLQRAWRRAARGPRFALLLGEAGIGKTRLVEELLDWARQQGIAQAYARCYAAEGELAYAPVTALLRAAPLPPLDEVWLTEVARLLPEVLVERPDLPHPRPMTEAWQRQRLFEALAHAVLGRGQPLLLVLEDLQWCSRESLDWLHFLLHFDPTARLLVVGTCRPEELDGDCAFNSTLPALHRDVRLTEIELGPLDEAQTATLADHLAGQALDATDTRWLYRETEGNPLFVVESLRAGLSTADKEWDAGGIHLPPRVQAVLQTRLAQLSPPARDLAGLAATVGRAFTFSVLRAAGDGDEDELVQGLDELWQRRIVHERGIEAYDFTHDKLREAAYNMLSPTRRRLLHRRVAQALEAVHGENPDPVAAQIAAHCDRAGYPQQAISFYLRAGQAANRVYARDEAVGSFQRGLALLEQGSWDETQQDWRPEMEAGLCEGLGDVLRLAAQYQAARDAYQRALVAVPAQDQLRQSLLLSKIGHTWWPQGDYRQALQAMNQAKSVLEPRPDEPDAAWWHVWGSVQSSRAYTFYFSNQTQELANTAQELEEVLEHYWSPYLFWACRTAQLQVRNRRERYVLSDESMADLLSEADLMDQMEDPDLRAVAFYGVGWMLQLHGDLDAAKDYLHEGLALAERTGNMVHQTWLLTWLSVLYRQRDEREACHQYAVHGLEAATIAGLAENAALVRGNLAWLAWCAGDDAEVEAQGRRALQLWQRSPFVYAFHWSARLPLLAVALEREQIAEALEHARAMLDPLQQKLPDPLEAALEAAVRAGEAQQVAEASVNLGRAVQVAQDTGFL